MRAVARVAMIVAGMTMAVPALAGERTGYVQIAAGDLSGAERTLQAERRIFPDRPELMLNLAAIYAATNRASEARSLYSDVLRRNVVPMDMPSGAVVSSHAVAHAGLNRLAPTMASR